MRYVIGFIVGVVLTVGGAAVYDHLGPGTFNPLVNWTTAHELEKASYQYVREQVDVLVDRLAKQLGIN